MIKGSHYQQVKAQLRAKPRIWLITGVAGFIGSNLLEVLLKLNQRVVGLDNFSTGCRRNLAQAVAAAGPAAASRFHLIEGDTHDQGCCEAACHGIDYLLHHAADTSAPTGWSDRAPRLVRGNRTSFLNVLNAARQTGVCRVVYAASGADYDSDLPPPKLVAELGRPFSQWATGRYIAEIDNDTCVGAYSMPSIGLRYFNVFGPRQSSTGIHAGVIGQWLAALVNDPDAYIPGSKACDADFCFVNNIVQANLLAAVSARPETLNRVFPVGMGETITLDRLLQFLRECLAQKVIKPGASHVGCKVYRPATPFPGPVDISKIRRLLGYVPGYSVADGLAATIAWYLRELVN